MSDISIFLGVAKIPDINLEIPFILGEQLLVHNAGERIELGFEEAALALMKKVYINDNKVLVGESEEPDSSLIEIDNNMENAGLFNCFLPAWKKHGIVAVEFRVCTAGIDSLFVHHKKSGLLFSLLGIWDGRLNKWVNPPISMAKEIFKTENIHSH